MLSEIEVLWALLSAQNLWLCRRGKVQPDLPSEQCGLCDEIKPCHNGYCCDCLENGMSKDLCCVCQVEVSPRTRDAHDELCQFTAKSSPYPLAIFFMIVLEFSKV